MRWLWQTIESIHFEDYKEGNDMVEYQIIQGENNKWEIWQYHKGKKIGRIAIYPDLRFAINWVRKMYSMRVEPRIIFDEI